MLVFIILFVAGCCIPSARAPNPSSAPSPLSTSSTPPSPDAARDAALAADADATVTEAECPVWMSAVDAAEGENTCRFPAVPLLVWLCADLLGAILLSFLRATRPATRRGAAQIVYCIWFVLFLPSHLVFRLVLFVHAACLSVLCCRRACSVCPAAKTKSTTSSGQVGVVMFLLGFSMELMFLLIVTGAWALQADHSLIILLIFALLWLICCVGNAHYATWQGLFGWGPENNSFGLLTPSVFRGNAFRLFFVHYALGTHPKVSDFERAREMRRDVTFIAALYAMAKPWLAPSDAIKELRSYLQDSYATHDSAHLEKLFKPLVGLLDNAGTELSWQHEWRPVVSTGGKRAVEVLVALGVVPTREVAEAAVRESHSHPGLTPEALDSLLNACAASGVSLDGLGEQLGWRDIWAPVITSQPISESKNEDGAHREHSDLLDKLAHHKVKPNRSAFEAALRDSVPLIQLEPMLRTLDVSDGQLLQGLGTDLVWEANWKPLVMKGDSELISLFARYGITPSLDVVDLAIRERAPTEAFEPLLASVSPDDMAKRSDTFGWDDVWKPLLLDGLEEENLSQTNRRLELFCAAGVVPSTAVMQMTIPALAGIGPIGAIFSNGVGYSPSRRVRDLSVMLAVAKKQIGLAEIAEHLSWEEVWEPIVSAVDGAAFMDLLHSHGIVPSTKVVEDAIYSAASGASRRLGGNTHRSNSHATEVAPGGRAIPEIPPPSMATAAFEKMFKASASKGYTEGIGETLPWDVWAPAIAYGDAKWIDLLCTCGIRPSKQVIETMFSSQASLACLQAAMISSSSPALSSTASPASRVEAGGKPFFDMLNEATWAQIAEREDLDAHAVAKLALSATRQPPPAETVKHAFAKLCVPEVVDLLVKSLYEQRSKADAGGEAEGQIVVKRLLLPGDLWSKLVQCIAEAASYTATLAAMASVSAKPEAPSKVEEPASKAHRAAALLGVALKTCEPPSPRLAAELWSQVVKDRAPAAARLLREHGYQPLATPRNEEISSSKSTVSALLLQAAKPPAPISSHTLIETSVLRASGAAGALIQKELINELVKCTEVRAHLERHSQTDRDAALQPRVESNSVQPSNAGGSITSADAERAQSIAARLLGREALRDQGNPVGGARLPPVQPLPDLSSLEQTVVSMPSGRDRNIKPSDVEHDHRLAQVKPFEGEWRRVGSGSKGVFRIFDGSLTWPDEFHRPPTQLKVADDGHLQIDLGDENYLGVLEEDPTEKGLHWLLWSDGDVWRRENTIRNVDKEAIANNVA